MIEDNTYREWEASLKNKLTHPKEETFYATVEPRRSLFTEGGIRPSKDNDHINPQHYQNGPMEVWEMMVKIWGEEKYIGFCQMNAFKYRMRAGNKEGQPAERDLTKAKWYEDKVKEIKSI